MEIIQPRVARNELPWVPSANGFPTLKGLNHAPILQRHPRLSHSALGSSSPPPSLRSLRPSVKIDRMNSRTPSRRAFLKTAGLAGAAIAITEGPCWRLIAADISGPVPPAPNWIDKPMRWAQLTLVEDDPDKFDPEFWLDYFRRTKSDAACLSAGGCVAYYPTKIPLHHRSQWLGDKDPFGHLVSGCRKLGMVVIGRTDPHATYDDVQAAHPDWIAVDANGKQRRHWASPEMWVTCALGPYNFDFMTAVKREIMERYRIDGIFINRWDGSGMCYCEHCRSNFRSEEHTS